MIHNLPNGNQPTNKYHHCSYSLCNAKINTDNQFCTKHWQVISQQYKGIKDKNDNRPSNRARRLTNQKKYNNTKRDKEANQFYHSQSWQRVRHYVLQRDIYTCQICGNNYQVNRLTVDHILPRKYCEDINQQLDPNNLWTLCTRCNGVKQYLEKQIENKYDNKAKAQFSQIGKQDWQERVKRITDREGK